jgi:hypothetical protein
LLLIAFACRWLSVAVGGCRSFRPHTPPRRRLPDLPSRTTSFLFENPRHVTTLWPISTPVHTGRYRKPASVDGPSFVPARPIPAFRRVYRIADP